MRTKQVFPKGQIAHIWAHQKQESARNPGIGNFYFEGKTIYSYGSHFPIAVLHGKNNENVLITRRTYSNTTAKHVWDVYRAVSHLNMIWCLHPESAANGSHTNNLQYWEDKAEDISANLPKAKKPENYYNAIATQKAEMMKYIEYFKIPKKAYKSFKFINIVPGDQMLEQIKKRQAEEKQAKINKQKKQIALEKVWVKGWKDFEVNENGTPINEPRLSIDIHTYLRVNVETKEIETSKGIKMSVEAGKRFYKLLVAIKNNGGCNGNCGDKKILDFNISAVTKDEVIIGCHNITWSEIYSIATLLNWPK